MSWDIFFNNEQKKPYFTKLIKKLDYEYANKVIFPKRSEIFKAFELVEFRHIQVVIIGQDPYHGENQAFGLAFAVLEGNKMPPSLRNIFKELEADLNIKLVDTDLSGWAKQGVLLLNKILTVEKAKASSHSDIGWEEFTDAVISYLNNRQDPIIFVLWGNYAKKTKKLIDNKKHYIIESAHPSPLSAYRGFFGSRPFSKINNILKSQGKSEIDWSL